MYRARLSKAGLRAATLASAVAVLASGPATADPFSPPQSKATLTIAYRLTGAGVDRPDSHERDITWSTENRYTVEATLVAQPPASYGGLHRPDAEQSAGLAERQAAAQAAAQNMQGMMQQAQAAVAKCGDDQACLQREVMAMSQGIDPNSPEMQAARQDAAKATAPLPGPRYQMFSAGPQSGTFAIAERAHQAYFDAACSLRNETPCAYDTTVAGQGPLRDGDGNATFSFGATAELDSKTGSLIVGLPPLGIATATKTVASHNPQVKTGRLDEARQMMNDPYVAQVEVSCGACRTASGSITRDVTDQLLGRPARLVIDWTFSRQ